MSTKIKPVTNPVLATLSTEISVAEAKAKVAEAHARIAEAHARGKEAQVRAHKASKELEGMSTPTGKP